MVSGSFRVRESGVTSDKMYWPRCMVHSASCIACVIVVLMSGCVVVPEDSLPIAELIGGSKLILVALSLPPKT